MCILHYNGSSIELRFYSALQWVWCASPGQLNNSMAIGQKDVHADSPNATRFGWDFTHWTSEQSVCTSTCQTDSLISNVVDPWINVDAKLELFLPRGQTVRLASYTASMMGARAAASSSVHPSASKAAARHSRSSPISLRTEGHGERGVELV
jgi:hypothetical protein